MGMAIIETPEPPPPRGENTTVCAACGAEYSSGPWVRLYNNDRHSTEAPSYVRAGDIPPGTCPVCLKPAKP